MKKEQTHTRIINFMGNSFFVEFTYWSGEKETNSPPSADIVSIYYNEVDVTNIIHHEDMDDMEDQIIDEFEEDFYYLSKSC